MKKITKKKKNYEYYNIKMLVTLQPNGEIDVEKKLKKKTQSNANNNRGGNELQWNKWEKKKS